MFDAVAPAYGSRSLADVLPSAFAVRGVPGATDRLGIAGQVAGVRKVVVLLIDGLGYHLLPVATPVAPTIREVLLGRLGTVARLTAGFPSTTPTSLVSAGTGAPPGAHGVLGFVVNVPGTDRLLTHIRWGDEPDPHRWQPLDTLFAAAARAGVATTVVGPEFTERGLTEAAYRGAAYRGADFADLADGVLAALAAAPDRALVYGYAADVDRTGHQYGIGSPEWLAAMGVVDRMLGRIVEALPPDAAVLVTADHGMIDVPLAGRIDADTTPLLRTGVRVLAGEPRVRYVHTLPGAAADVRDAWRAIIGSAGYVLTREEAIATGWYGPVPADHAERLGDLVVVMRDRHVVMASRTEPRHIGRRVAFHGSVTEPEMAIPLIMIRS